VSVVSAAGPFTKKKLCTENLRDQLEDVGINGKIILKWYWLIMSMVQNCKPGFNRLKEVVRFP
jgi:hypothetical protein